MALTGQLSDMSLAELIEFFCNQRKTGRLKVDYHRGHGVFFIKEGELVDAKVGQLSGAEAVYFALTMPNAAFDFSPEVPPTRRTISESWTQVVLEGLRRLDEGLSPSESDAFGGWSPSESDMALFMDQVDRLGVAGQKSERKTNEAAPLSMMVENAGAGGGGRKKLMLAGAAGCIVLAVVVGAIPFLRGSSKTAASATPKAATQPEPSASAPAGDAAASPATPEAVAPALEVSASADDAALAAQREQREREQKWREQRERERRADESARKAEAATGANANSSTPAAAPAGPKSVRVQITYDEAGRVTAASVAGASPGAEAFGGTAVRVARGRRFPAGKAGSTVVTIPVN
jgi:TonB family protein